MPWWGHGSRIPLSTYILQAGEEKSSVVRSWGLGRGGDVRRVNRAWHPHSEPFPFPSLDSCHGQRDASALWVCVRVSLEWVCVRACVHWGLQSFLQVWGDRLLGAHLLRIPGAFLKGRELSLPHVVETLVTVTACYKHTGATEGRGNLDLSRAICVLLIYIHTHFNPLFYSYLLYDNDDCCWCCFCFVLI